MDYKKSANVSLCCGYSEEPKCEICTNGMGEACIAIVQKEEKKHTVCAECLFHLVSESVAGNMYYKQ